MDHAVITQIENLSRLKVADLKLMHLEVLGEPSRSSNKEFLFRRIAWRIQANAMGGLSERASARAAEIADDADLRVRAPRGFLPGPSLSSFVTIDRSGARKDWRLPAPGTVITKRVGDRLIAVEVLKDGFEYQSRKYRSLSAIAREITGTRWNGLLFFGLKGRRHG